MLPSGHRLAARKTIRPQALETEHYITPTKTAPTLKTVIDGYASRVGITLKPEYEADNLATAMSVVASTGGITLLRTSASSRCGHKSRR